MLALDGVFVAVDSGAPVFVSLPELTALDIADLLQVVRVRVLRFLLRRGVIEDEETLTVLPGPIAEREPALAQLAAAAVSGLAPAGPERRDRPLAPVRLRGSPGVRFTAPLAASELGFSLHGATTAAAEDERGREALVRYVLRPPIAQDRLKLLPNDLVRIELRRPFADGTTAVELDPLSLLCRLCAAIPPPRFNTVRYAGVLGPASRWRSLVVPPPAEPALASGRAAPAPHESSRPQTHRSRWRPWHELIKRSFAADVQQCPGCGGRMKLKRLLMAPESIRRFLRHLGEPAEPPPRAPARDPPFYKSCVLRRRPQPEMQPRCSRKPSCLGPEPSGRSQHPPTAASPVDGSAEVRSRERFTPAGPKL
jgi:hypothetical protein